MTIDSSECFRFTDCSSDMNPVVLGVPDVGKGMVDVMSNDD